jgi:hypothetical protein
MVPVPLRESKERYGPDLDALSYRGIWSRGGILEGGMADKASAAVSLRIVGFEDDDLFRSHLRKIPPFMSRRVAHHIILAITIAVAKVKLEEVFGLGRSYVAHFEIFRVSNCLKNE